MQNEILVTDWEKVEADDFYLSEKWAKKEGVEEMLLARKLCQKGKLYIAYIVNAVEYAVFTQMDAQQVFIDGDCNILVYCESAIISNNHGHRIALDE